MQTAKEFIADYLEHAYDPVKAHEYYERTKKLKGRNKAAVAGPADRRGSTSGEATLVTAPRRPAAKSAKELRQAAKARVEALQVRLDRLNDLLAELTRQAKARSGVETEKKDSGKQTESKDKPRSAADKRKAAKAAKEAYEKEKKTSPDKEAEALQAKIKAVREKIQEIREELRADGSKARKKKNRSEAQLTATAATGR